MQAILTKTDFDKFLPLPNSLDFKTKVEPYILKVQEILIQQFLGDALFYDFITNITQEKYQDLLNGKTYENCDGHTVFFRGLKPAIIYYSHSVVLVKNRLHLTAGGYVHKEEDNSSMVSLKEVVMNVGAEESDGNFYLNQTKKYLDANKETYPLWKSGERTQKIGVRAKKIG